MNKMLVVYMFYAAVCRASIARTHSNSTPSENNKEHVTAWLESVGLETSELVYEDHNTSLGKYYSAKTQIENTPVDIYYVQRDELKLAERFRTLHKALASIYPNGSNNYISKQASVKDMDYFAFAGKKTTTRATMMALKSTTLRLRSAFYYQIIWVLKEYFTQRVAIVSLELEDILLLNDDISSPLVFPYRSVDNYEDQDALQVVKAFTKLLTTIEKEASEYNQEMTDRERAVQKLLLDFDPAPLSDEDAKNRPLADLQSFFSTIMIINRDVLSAPSYTIFNLDRIFNREGKKTAAADVSMQNPLASIFGMLGSIFQ